MSAEPMIDDTEQPATARRAASSRRTRIEKALDLPPRPKTREVHPDTEWMQQAACAEAPKDDREAFLTAARQADAWPLVARYCVPCPVARACLADARAVHSSTLSGGVVLDDGHLAPDRPGDAAFRSTAAWTPPWDRDDEDAEVPTDEVDLVALAADGITAARAAQALGAKGRTEVGRRLTALERAGHLRKEPAAIGPNGHPIRWFAVEEPKRSGQRWQPRRRKNRKDRRR